MTTDNPADPLEGLESQVEQLRRIGQLFYSNGWSTGTSSNYSVVTGRDPLEILITASGMDKGNLGPNDFVRVDGDACPVFENQPRSSAETWLHVVAASRPDVGAVLHTHSIWATLLSDLFRKEDGFWIEGYEMLKGLAGITTHEHRHWVPIYDNTQDIRDLAETVRPRFDDPGHPPFCGFLIRRHGLYTWGRDLSEARRHVEVFEFLFECVGRRLSIK